MGIIYVCSVQLPRSRTSQWRSPFRPQGASRLCSWSRFPAAFLTCDPLDWKADPGICCGRSWQRRCPLLATLRNFINLAEQQVVDIYQTDSKQVDKHMGRSQPLRLEQARTRAPQRLPFPRLSPVAMWWRRAAYAFHSLSYWHSSLCRGRALSACRRLLREAGALPLVKQLQDASLWLHVLSEAADYAPELMRCFEKGARARAERESMAIRDGLN